MEVSWDDLTQRHAFPVSHVWLAELFSSAINNCFVQCYVWNKASFIFFF